MNYRGDLNTEQQNTRSLDIDNMDVRDILITINNEDSHVADAVKAAIPDIEKTVKFYHNTTRLLRI